MVRIARADLKELMKKKLNKAGLTEDHADGVADVLVHADARGIHSHGAMRVEYYAERIAKGGITHKPNFEFKKTGPASGTFEGDNGAGHVAAKEAMDEAIKLAKESGIAIVGVKHISHSGALSYFVDQAAREDMVGISMCQSDPMVVPYGGSEPYYGTNPIAFAAPGKDGQIVTFDMATTVQAWGKILHARSKKVDIPSDWAVDGEGNPTTDPFKVQALVPIAGPKGYGLMLMVDVLAGILLGVPHGANVSSMYADLTKGRDLGQLHIVINPTYFTDLDSFKENLSSSMQDLNNIKPADGFDMVNWPGQRSAAREKAYEEKGIEIVDEVYDYLVSDVIHNNSYDHKDPFAE